MNDRCPDQVLFIARSLFISIAWTMVHSLSLSRSLAVFISFPPFWFTSFLSFLFFSLSPFEVFESSPREQPLDKTSDLYEDYVDLGISIAFEGDNRF